MTDEMLSLAISNAAKAGATDVEFLKGDIESIPLPGNTIDVVISNCSSTWPSTNPPCSPRRSASCVPVLASASGV